MIRHVHFDRSGCVFVTTLALTGAMLAQGLPDPSARERYRSEIGVVRKHFLPIQWTKELPPRGDAVSVNLLEMCLQLPESFRAVNVMEEQLRKQWVRAELVYTDLAGNRSTVLVTVDKFPADVAEFYTPRIVGSEDTTAYWDAVRLEAKKYPSTLASLAMFDGMEKEPPALERLDADALKLLAAKCHVRRILLGFDQCEAVESKTSAVLFCNVSGSGEKGVAAGYLFDDAGTFRGDLTIHAPVETLERNENWLLAQIVAGIDLKPIVKPR